MSEAIDHVRTAGIASRLPSPKLLAMAEVCDRCRDGHFADCGAARQTIANWVAWHG
jgi:hypothetical protein